MLILLTALGAWAKPDYQYILFHAKGTDFKSTIHEVDSAFPATARPKTVRIGVAMSFTCMNTDSVKLVSSLKGALDSSVAKDIPVFICLDVEQWWNSRPDLWNWFDSTAPGFDPANAENVEWYGWSSAKAIKISWRNWGSQIRVKPAPNLLSSEYRAAAVGYYKDYLPIIAQWEKSLPADKKYLFAGIKVGWESGIGLNAAYHPNGNYYYETWPDDPSHDPEWPKGPLPHPPAYLFQQIGYAALKTSGIKTSGAITEDDLAEVTHRHLEELCKTAVEQGIPRAKILTHVIPWTGAGLDYLASYNPYCGPGWSYYGNNPKGIRDDRPKVDSAITKAMGAGAPGYGVVETWLQTPDYAPWYDYFTNVILLDPNNRLVSLYNWDSAKLNPNIIKAAKDVVSASPVSLSGGESRIMASTKTVPRLLFDGKAVRTRTEPKGAGVPEATTVRLPDGRR